MISIHWSAPARRDLANIDDFYAKRNPEFAAELGRKIIAAAAFLSENPRVGSIVGLSNWRKWRIGGTHYLLLFRVDGRTLRILRVQHDKQNWFDLT